jgi:hypothetical protein
MRELWTLIPAAGSSERWRAAGFEKPKALLSVRLGGLTMPMWQHVGIAASLLSQHTLVGLPPDCDTWGNDITEGILVGRTRGQAETVLKMLRIVPRTMRVLVLDCDTLLQTSDLEYMCSRQEQLIVAVTRSNDPNMSRPDRVPNAQKFVEKQQISEWGVVGARLFRSAHDLANALHWSIAEDARLGREPYLTGAMNLLLGTNHCHDVEGRWIDWGTPERLRASGAEVVP